mmetsp:Transcript_15873/g.18057  ORF Transcript_15873/g.18057 Transcript_15873/m.18057 type:complete len:242 (+) Transcript_15873:250-975(+)
MNFLSSRTVTLGEGVTSDGLYFLAQVLEGKEKKKIKRSHCTRNTSPKSVPLIELIPRFEHDSPEDWGSLPPEPEGRKELVESILDTWQKQDSAHGFILFVDGNPSNCSLANLKRVDLGVALRHFDDWKVDWDMNLTEKQNAFVRAHSKYFRRLAKVLFRRKKICAYCGKLNKTGNNGITIPLKACSACKQNYYCCVEHQKKDWPDHKEDCKLFKSMRTNTGGNICMHSPSSFLPKREGYQS